MDFDLTKEQKMIRDEVRKFARKEIAPKAEELERTGEYPYDLMEKMAKLGLMGIPFPEEYGGTGGDWVSLHLVIEELSRAEHNSGSPFSIFKRYNLNWRIWRWPSSSPEICISKRRG